MPNDAENLFCPLPFLQLELKPTGKVAPCCWLPSVDVGDAKRESLAAIWNGPKLRRLRREFLDAQPRTCARAMRHVGCHRRFDHLLPHVERAEVQTQPPRRLDVRLNGRCNLECTMCEVWTEPNGVYDATDFWARGEAEIFPRLLELDVLGGEPFIQRDTFRLIDAIAPVNPRCTWGFVTNGAWRWGAAIEARLDRIAIRYLHVSIDSLDSDRYARIRRRGDLARTLATLEALRAYRDRRGDFELRISMCVQRENWAEMGAFYAFAVERGLGCEFQFLTYPRALSLDSLEPTVRAGVLGQVVAWREIFRADSFGAIEAPLRESLERRPVAR